AFEERFGEMGTVDVGYEKGAEIAFGVGLECLCDHNRTEIRAAYTDVDDGVDGFPGVALPVSVPDRLGELLHVFEDTTDLVYALLVDGEVAVKVAEGDVQDCTVLGGVDVLPAEHLVAGLLDLCFAEEGEESFEDGFCDEMF